VSLTPRTVDLPTGTYTWYAGGVPDAPPVLLLHALGRDGADWLPVAGALGADHRLVAPDQRGHGASPRPGRYSSELFRDDALALLDALELDRVDVVGHSMGGTVAYLLAAAHPDRVGRLVIEDVPMPRGRQHWAQPRRPDKPVPFDWAVVEPIWAQLVDPPVTWWDGLGRITAPTLIVGGGPGSHVDQDELVATAAAIADARVVTIETGHAVHRTAPAAFAAAVVPFLGADRGRRAVG
jgi:3-oxoadipate enol-lactonase